mmetsp:Transcript_23608/g.74167  ORF Transcript_23608/g.74167 Transcript_23608/m.74167 type:complete len:208 (-) Transcript_23608:447-1070(-)
MRSSSKKLDQFVVRAMRMKSVSKKPGTGMHPNGAPASRERRMSAGFREPSSAQKGFLEYIPARSSTTPSARPRRFMAMDSAFALEARDQNAARMSFVDTNSAPPSTAFCFAARMRSGSTLYHFMRVRRPQSFSAPTFMRMPRPLRHGRSSALQARCMLSFRFRVRLRSERSVGVQGSGTTLLTSFLGSRRGSSAFTSAPLWSMFSSW